MTTDPTMLVLRAFASAMMAKVAAARAGLPATHRRRLLESISDDIKKVSNLCPHEVSVAAATEAEMLGVDLCEQTWHDQLRFDPEREVFHVEHMVPVSALRELCLGCTTEEEIFGILRTRLRIVWILKTEDDALTRLGFRHRRPDPGEAYRLAGITIRAK